MTTPMDSNLIPEGADPSDSFIDELRASAPRARDCGVSAERWLIQRAHRTGYRIGHGRGFTAGHRSVMVYSPNSPNSPRRYDVKALLRDPAFRRELIEAAVDFICKVEGIRQ